jgi:hydroxyethylthiazole kinase-like uncharacterized protein yjeF
VHPKLGKVGRGTVLAVGGSAQNPGAIMLAAVAALKAGAGRVQIATARSVATHLAVAIPEARVIGLVQARSGEIAGSCSRKLHQEVSTCDALLVGPGMVDETAAVDLVTHCMRVSANCPLVLDAAALKTFKRTRPCDHAPGVVATPHAGEMARLWGCESSEVLESPLDVAREAARAFNVVLVLKGDTTFIVAPDGAAYVNTAGGVGLGTAGSGDTLCGVIAGLAARGATPLQAAVWGVYLHAKAGDALAQTVAPLGFLARELLGQIPPLLAAAGDQRKG